MRDEEPHTSIVVPSLTLDQSEIRKLAGASGRPIRTWASALYYRTLEVLDRETAYERTTK